MKISLCDVRKETLSLVGIHDLKFSHFFVTHSLEENIYAHVQHSLCLEQKKLNKSKGK